MKEEKKILLTGLKPSGRPHIGNYFGMMKPTIDLINSGEYHSFVFIPDYHALISVQNGEQMKQNILNVALDFLAIGLDPKKVIFYKQSDIPIHNELTWIFNCLTTMPSLMRAHAFKDAEAKNKDVSVGLFDYPILMAADILMYDTNIVPVGKDQIQHVEIAREIARKFNHTFGKTFVEPQEKVKEEVATVIGADGQKMSKSYNNHLPLFASPEKTEKYIMSIPMDSKGIDEIKNPDVYNLYKIFQLFATAEEDQKIRAMFENGGVGYAEIKKYVAKKINAYLAPMRARRKEWENKPEEVLRILKEGGEKAKKIAEKKMKGVREKIGFKIYN